MDLRRLIDKARADLDTPVTDTVNVVVGGELVPVTLVRLRPDEWQALTEQHPPRKGVEADSNTGYDQAALARTYPRVVVDGEPAGDDWADVWDVLNAVNRNVIIVAIWNLNIFHAITEINALGKASAGRSSNSPALPESPRAASKGGNRRKSPRSTTTGTV